MALQVWLPLNGNLNNQGLADVSVTSGTAKYKIGKIGNGLDLSSRIMFSCPELVGLKQFTIMFWVKIEDDDSITSNWQDIFGTYEQKADGSSYGQFRAETCYATESASRLGVHWHGNHGITSGTLPTHYTGDRGIWHHCAIVVDSDQFIKSYTDGVLKNEYTTELTGGHLYNGTFWLGETNNIAGCINDVRIYDNCLSPREVKEISKGLVLHYPLAMPGQENLQQGTTSIGATNVPGWVSNGGGTTLEKIDGNIIHFKRTISDSKVIPTIALNCVTPCDFNSSYVYSIDLKFDRDIITTGSTPAHFWYGARNTDSIFNTSCNGNLSNRSSSIISPSASTVIPANTWYTQKVRINFGDGPTSEGYDYPAIRCFVYGGVLSENYTGEVNGWMKNCKVEKGTVATPWIPNPADAEYSALGFDDGIEYDVSGYGRNGIKNNITNSSDTPRYNTSSVFDGSSSYISLSHSDFNPLLNGEAIPFTVAFWIYHADSTRGIIFGDYGLGGNNTNVELTTGHIIRFYWAGSPDIVFSGAVSLATWTHVALIYNGTNIYFYKNGVLEDSRTVSLSAKSKVDGEYRIGRDHRSDNTMFNGRLSDFRIYATALSADDILELYHTSASLANNGTLMAYEFNEV